MRKLLTATAIAFLMIFTAGLATAAPVTTHTGTGTLYFVAVNGTSITEVDGVTITISQVAPETTPDTDQPGNLWAGTLVIPSASPLSASATTTLNISAIKALPTEGDVDHYFRDIAGTDSAGTIILAAEGNALFHTKNLALNPVKVKPGFFIHGKIYDGTTFTGTFKGTLFY